MWIYLDKSYTELMKILEGMVGKRMGLVYLGPRISRYPLTQSKNYDAGLKILWIGVLVKAKCQPDPLLCYRFNLSPQYIVLGFKPFSQFYIRIDQLEDYTTPGKDIFIILKKGWVLRLIQLGKKDLK